MITITIPFIPSLFAILSFIMFIFIEIDESDRILLFVISVMLSSVVFFATYGFFTMLGAF